ncbi:MAG: hypothetical protein JXL80_06105 [Planctomycetes bacterium]|nr:hypothetical protein [Planctomycetota bacterium]
MNETPNIKITTQAQPPQDNAHRDRAVEPEYAAVSVMAILALILAGIGALALLPKQAYVLIPGLPYKAPILLVLPVASFFFALLARRKIVCSEGTLVGLRAANTAVMLSAAFVLGSIGLHGYLQHRQYTLNEAMLADAQHYLDRILQDDYEGVYNEMMANNPALAATGLSLKRFRSEIRGVLNSGGDYYGRNLQSQDVRVPDDPSQPAEIQGRVVHRFHFKKGAVDLTFVFAQRNGQWKLMVVGQTVTAEFPKPGSVPKKRYEL